MPNKKNNSTSKVFSKDSQIVEISSKQEQLQVQEVKPPVKPKEIKQK
ncbi:hypothetical protein [Lacrimispora sp.]|nr:hypothetical protein [Lacrimispora sp.]